MRVGFNTFPLAGGHSQRGVGVYTKNLLSALRTIPDLEIEEFADISRLTKVDLIHYPYFDLFAQTLPFRKKYPTVVTIHDVTPLIFPDHYPPGIRGRFNNFLQQKALGNVKAVITQSEAAKKDILKYLKLEDQFVHPVLLAASPNYRQIKDSKYLREISQKYKLPPQFALFTGNVNWNKNLLGLTQACISSHLPLFLVGKSFSNRQDLDHPELKTFKEFLQKYSNNPDVHALGFVEDEELVGLMNLATLFIFPSFYEGFGMPVLEAQACGTPVITSNTSALPEVAGEGALFVDPSSPEEISAAISLLIKDQKIRDNLIKKGFQNVFRFSWQKTAERTYQVYQQALLKK